jgi:hypothetical protein
MRSSVSTVDSRARASHFSSSAATATLQIVRAADHESSERS